MTANVKRMTGKLFLAGGLAFTALGFASGIGQAGPPPPPPPPPPPHVFQAPSTDAIQAPDSYGIPHYLPHKAI